MPFIRDLDEDKYYDQQELRQLKLGTGLFPPGHTGHGLFPPGQQPSGYGYRIAGEGVIDGLASMAKFAGQNRDIIKGIVQTATDVASTIRSQVNSNKGHIYRSDKSNDNHIYRPHEVIDKKALQKIRKKAGLPVGSGFRFD